MNIKRIIKEELSDMDWIGDINPQAPKKWTVELLKDIYKDYAVRFDFGGTKDAYSTNVHIDNHNIVYDDYRTSSKDIYVYYKISNTNMKGKMIGTYFTYKQMITVLNGKGSKNVELFPIDEMKQIIMDIIIPKPSIFNRYKDEPIKEEIDSDWDWMDDVIPMPMRDEWTKELLHDLLGDYIIKYDYDNEGEFYYLVDEVFDEDGEEYKTSDTQIAYCWDDESVGCYLSPVWGEMESLNGVAGAPKATNLELIPKGGFQFSWGK